MDQGLEALQAADVVGLGAEFEARQAALGAEFKARQAALGAEFEARQAALVAEFKAGQMALQAEITRLGAEIAAVRAGTRAAITCDLGGWMRSFEGELQGLPPAAAARAGHCAPVHDFSRMS